MRNAIFGALLAGGLVFTAASPARAQYYGSYGANAYPVGYGYYPSYGFPSVNFGSYGFASGDNYGSYGFASGLGGSYGFAAGDNYGSYGFASGLGGSYGFAAGDNYGSYGFASGLGGSYGFAAGDNFGSYNFPTAVFPTVALGGSYTPGFIAPDASYYTNGLLSVPPTSEKATATTAKARKAKATALAKKAKGLNSVGARSSGR